KLSEIVVKYGDYSDVLAEVQPIIGNDTNAEIIILPGNSMAAMYEIVQPPTLTLKKNPIEDSFDRSSSSIGSINYAKNNSLSVGNYQGEEYQSFVKFDFTNFNKSNVVLNANLRLYYNGEMSSSAEPKLYSLVSNWSELGITGRNKPPIQDLVAEEF